LIPRCFSPRWAREKRYWHNIAKDQIVFAQGDVADTVFYVQKGRVKVVVISEQGKEAVVGILEPGQFFGEGCMKRSLAAHRDDDGDGRMPGYGDHENGHACGASQRTEVFGDVPLAYLLTRNSRIEEDFDRSAL